MKTLHLVNAWQAEGGGGISTFYRALLQHARQASQAMVLVAPGESDSCHEEGTTRIYTVRAPVTFLNDRYRMILPNAWPGINRGVHEILRQEQPDLLDVCDKYSLHYAAGLLRRNWLSGVQRPVLIATSCERMDENMAYYLSKSDMARRFCRYYVKWNYFGYFDHHVTVSAHTAEELREASRGHVRGRGVWVCPMGVEAARFRPSLRTAAARQRLVALANARESSRLLVYAGRLAPEKNLPLLLDVFQRLRRQSQPDYRLLICGDGILRAKLEAECRQRLYGVVSFLGHVGPGELPELLANADAFIHPNPREPFGIAPLEAMASGLPLVACDSGGITYYANASNAWLSAPEAEPMAQSVEKVFADDGLRDARVRSGLGTAQHFDWPRVAADFRRLYTGFVSGQPSGAAFESTPGNWLGVEETI